jgi:hypothetical protein
MSRLNWCLLALTLALAGCVETDGLLSDPADGTPDPSLYGHWVAKQVEGGVTTEFHAFIGKHKTAGNPKGLMDLQLTAFTPQENGVERGEFTYVCVTKLGKSAYLNLIPAPADFDTAEQYTKWSKEPKKVAIARYECDGKTIKIWLADTSKKSEDRIKQLVQAGELKKKDHVQDAASLATYLAKNGGEELFDELFLTFTKVP